MIKKVRALCRATDSLSSVLIIFAVCLLCAGCGTPGPVSSAREIRDSSSELNLLETCRLNLGIASPDTLKSSVNLLKESGIIKTEAGRECGYLASEIMKLAYPVSSGSGYSVDAPAGSFYSNVFADIAAGRYPQPPADKTSFFTILISPMTVLYSANETNLLLAEEHVKQARAMNGKSVLPVFLDGYIAEKRNDFKRAEGYYREALAMDPSCYPAETGLARVYMETGKPVEAVRIMDALAAQYPYSFDILLLSATARFESGDFSAALEQTAVLLGMRPDNPEVLLLRTGIYLNQRDLQQASRLIDVLGRARYTVPAYYYYKSELERAEGRSEDALKTLEEARGRYPANTRLTEAYGAALLLTGRRDEGREFLESGAGEKKSGLRILLEDSIASKDWEKAVEYARQLEAGSPDKSDGILIWSALAGSGLKEDALEKAEALYSADPEDSELAVIYTRSLIGMGRRLQAGRIISGHIEDERDSGIRSQLYYLQSLVTDNEEERLQALRSSLFENLKNTEALLEISRLYVEMGDYRKAYRYIKQAAVLEPEDAGIRNELKRVEGYLN